MSQVSDRKTIGIPGPAGDASPEMIAAAEARAAAAAQEAVDALNLPKEVADQVKAQVKAQVTPVLVQAAREGAAEALAQLPEVIDEAVAKAQSDAGLVRTTDARLAVPAPLEVRAGWSDRITGRTPVWADQFGTVHAARPIDAPAVGLPNPLYNGGSIDLATGRMSENTVDRFGRLTVEASRAIVARGGGSSVSVTELTLTRGTGLAAPAWGGPVTAQKIGPVYVLAGQVIAGSSGFAVGVTVASLPSGSTWTAGKRVEVQSDSGSILLRTTASALIVDQLLTGTPSRVSLEGLVIR